MTWEYFFNHYDAWDIEVVRERIDLLDGIGTMQEVVIVITDLGDEEIGEILLDKAFRSGEKLFPDDIVELVGSIEESYLNELVKKVDRDGAVFLKEHILALYGEIEEDLLSKITMKSPSDFSEEDLMELEDFLSERAFRHIEKGHFTKEFARRKAIPEEENRFKLGDLVWVKYIGTEGRIIDINGSLYMVSMRDGEKVDSFMADELEKALGKI